MSNAKDLESILTAHKNFVSTIYDRCFLHENNTAVRDCILHLLNLAVVFQRLWDEGVHTLRYEKATDTIFNVSYDSHWSDIHNTNFTSSKSSFDHQVNEFNRCLQILISFITPLSRTGSLPHRKYESVIRIRNFRNQEI